MRWLDDGPIWLIGCGNMAGAMLRRWLGAGLPPSQVTVIRPSGVEPAPEVRTLDRLPEGEAAPRLLLLGVKPQKLDEVAPDVAKAVGPETLLVSILAGTSLGALWQRFPTAGAIVRAMPNTPVALGRGVVLLHGQAGERHEALENLLAPLGSSEWLNDEHIFDAASALTASGPAFVFRFISAMAAAGAALGVEPAQALRLALGTADGAAGLARGSGESPDQLAERVASVGGMTRKGLDVLDEEGALVRLITRTMQAAERRARELAEQTR
ncbi:NAD(P)-binding domain-containing protein [Sphingomonas sp. ID1715]|uniref:pyrroline-5-carboxylate reductase family protein n=1 Tax=Sphingomonas sp. ID1715 TaxID=1656898 RepID=UPI0014893DE9|nr:pyrroline-5-carboxylate reductase dimerization domain-containing protein [Sphingomonas sp. ID1715]NNM75756.1 NAD(P)-binding domain-containing protein [Sphingomonas sp. ID1715]